MAIICKYKFNSTLCADYIPEFNSEFTGYTKTDVDNGDNTITRTIEHDTLKPTLIRFGNSQSVTDREKSLLELIECNTSNVTNMDSMFFGCGSLTSLNLSNFNTSKVTNMSAMFYNCNKLTSLDLSNFNTSKVINMNSMFNGCTSLTSLDLSNFDTIKVNNMGYMFSNCNKLTSLDLSNFNTSNVISMLGMFRTCSSLTSLDVSNFNTSKVNNMRDMFSDCTLLSSLNISNFNTSNVNNMGYMFNGCSSLTSLNLSNFNTSKVQHMFDMFSGCTSLTSLDLSNFNTINVTNMSYMFYDCTSLSDIGMVYCNKATIDKVSLLIQHTANIYVNSVIPENCIPVEGITFIFDGDIKTLYLNSPLLEGDTIEEKDGGIYHVHRSEQVVFDGSSDEGWVQSPSNDSTKPNYFIWLNNVFYKYASNNQLCDKMRISNPYSDYSQNIVKIINGSARIRKDDYLEVGISSWLQSNPITLVAQLVEPQYELIEQSNLVIPSYANGHLDFNTAVPVEKVEFKPFTEELTYLYPSTSYTVQFVSDRETLVDLILGGTLLLSQSIVVGLNRISITTPSELVDNKLVISGIANISKVVVTDTNRQFRYFEGMKSVGECGELEVKSCNKNLLDYTQLYDENNFIKTYEIYGFWAYKVKVEKGKTYTVSVGATEKITIDGKTPYLCITTQEEYQKTPNQYKEWINHASLKFDNVVTITSTDGYLYIQVSSDMNKVKSLLDNIGYIQIEEGTTATDYIPHQSNSQQLNHEPLRAVGESKDRYVLIDGKWYIERNCAEFILTDSLDYSLGNTSSTPFIQFTFELGSSSDYTTTDKIICNRLKTTNVYSNNTNIGICYIKNDTIRIRLTNSDTLDSFKTWLNQGSTVIVYALPSPIYEEINYNPFETYSDVTHISTNSLIPTNMVIKNHGYNCILKPSTTYTVALNKPNGTISAKLGGSAKVDSTNSIFTITTPSTLNDNVLRLSGSGNVKDIMILEGDKTVNTPSYFEGIESVFEQEYDAEKGKYRVTARVEGNGKESSIIFYLNEPLRGTGSAKDKVFIQDSKVVVERNCSSITLDGSKNIHKANTDFDSVNNISFSIDIDNIAPSWANCNNIVCSTLPNVGNRTWKGNMEGITSNDIIILLCISRNKLQTQDVNGFKQWLQANPTKVVYVLAEPVYEEADCDLSKLVLENYENSSLIFESNIPVSANIKYSGEVPVVTQAKALSSKVDNTTLDINENIIPYMCDIDYRIVELQLMNGDTQGEGIELLGIGDIEILGNENVLFNNREDKKHNYSYDMLKRDILSQRYSKEEYQYRLDRYLLANKISDEEYKELEGLLNNGE